MRKNYAGFGLNLQECEKTMHLRNGKGSGLANKFSLIRTAFSLAR